MYKIKANKKNFATGSDTNIPKLTSETNSGTSSFIEDNISQFNENVKLPSQYNIPQNIQNMN